ncbi:MAG: DUF3592 domain-containing protein [Bacilli bacterium]|jgi:fructose-1,6-bisphosphatase
MKKIKKRYVIASVVIFLSLGAFAYGTYSVVDIANEYANYGNADSTVLSIWTETNSEEHTLKYKIEVAYVDYQNIDRVSCLSNYNVNYEVGDVVNIYYVKDHPEESAFIEGPNYLLASLWFVIGIIYIGGTIFVLVLYQKRELIDSKELTE